MGDISYFFYDVVLPFLGSFFGRLGGLAMSSTSDVLLWIGNDLSLTATNIFTGAEFIIVSPASIPVLGKLFTVLCLPVRTLLSALSMFYNVGDLPFVFGFLIVFVSALLVIVLCKFLWDLLSVFSRFLGK